MTNLIKRDNNELRYNAIWLLEKDGNPNYYKNLIKNAKAFFFGMEKEEYIAELDKKIKDVLEERVGVDINTILLVYKNLPYLNSYTKSKREAEREEYIYKYTIENWLDEIEVWIFRKAITLEKHIRFTIAPKQHV
jgi:hypothetical protein